MTSIAFFARLLLSPLPLGALAVGAIAFWLVPADSRIWKAAAEGYVGLYLLSRGAIEFNRNAAAKGPSGLLVLLGLYFFGSTLALFYRTLALDLLNLALLIAAAVLTSATLRTARSRSPD